MTKGLLKEWALTRNSLKIPNQKNQKIQSSYGEQNKRTKRPQGQKLNMKACSQEEINWSVIEKSVQNKTVWSLQDQN